MTGDNSLFSLSFLVLQKQKGMAGYQADLGIYAYI